MLNELPKLLDRNFAVGYFLPAALLVVAVCLLLPHYGLSAVPSADDLNKLILTVMTALVIWLLAIGLMALNYPFLRLLEGYGRFHPLRWRAEHMRSQYRRTAIPALTLQRNIEQSRGMHIPEIPMPHDHPA